MINIKSIQFSYLLRHATVPLKQERSSYLEYQKVTRELEHLSRLSIAYQFVQAEVNIHVHVNVCYWYKVAYIHVHVNLHVYMLLAKKHYTCNYILHVALLLNVHVQYAVFIEFQHTPGFISYPVKNSITRYICYIQKKDN